ncbi:unnamed protein product [Arctogadus glacialis]
MERRRRETALSTLDPEYKTTRLFRTYFEGEKGCLIFGPIRYANKGSHALQAHCQTEVHKEVLMIASTHSVASSFLPASARVNPASQSQANQGSETIRQQCQS